MKELKRKIKSFFTKKDNQNKSREDKIKEMEKQGHSRASIAKAILEKKI